MTFEETYLFCITQGREIGRLMLLKDKLATKVIHAYNQWHKSKLDPKLQNELIVVVDEYVRRQCTVTEIPDLERRYGVAGKGHIQ